MDQHSTNNNLPSLKKPSILIVDDEQLVCWSLENAFKKAGYQTVTANSAEQAIGQIHSRQFDVVITDMNLPQKDGFSVVDGVKTISPKSAVVMISAFGDSRSYARAKEHRVQYFVDKPFNLDDMLALVRSVLQRQC